MTAVAAAQTTTAAPVQTENTSGGISLGAINNGTSIGPSEAVSGPQVSVEQALPLTHPEALFPNIFGQGQVLRDHGTAVLFDTRNEFDDVISGPRGGSSNAGQYAFEVDTDWEKLANLTGLTTHFLMVGRYGIPISRQFGDELNPSQEIYGAGGNVVSHLVYAYAEETLAHGAFDVAAGRNPLLDDFLASPLYCNFENRSFCGNPRALSANASGFSVYPEPVWGGRLRLRPLRALYVQLGLYTVESGTS